MGEIRKKELSFLTLVSTIKKVNDEFTIQANKAVNTSLTLRNWFIGYYIQEYEQQGSDRAKYATQLLESLSLELQKVQVSRVEARELRRYRKFYQIYPQIRDAVAPELKNALLVFQKEKRESLTPISGKEIVSKLSFTHIAELIKINDQTKRAFYEAEAIKSGWSVQELKRQINSLYYERSGLSINKKKLSEIVHKSAEKNSVQLNIRDPYLFEFLGLKSKEVMSESHLEDELMDKLQEFLLELGHGFCFESRQKRILIGDEYFFIDLVFYHRILKCHILIELKLEAFNHENIGQLNTYVNWYKKNMMTKSDNPPVGILLCTKKNKPLVEYALAGMDKNLFVSKYQIELPKKEDMQKFITEVMRDEESGGGDNG